MAARNQLWHDDRTRAKIQASQLVNRLISLAEGKIKPEEMPAHVVTAALGLIKKIVPDLQAVQHSGDPENPIAHRVDVSGLTDDQLRALASIKLGE